MRLLTVAWALCVLAPIARAQGADEYLWTLVYEALALDRADRTTLGKADPAVVEAWVRNTVGASRAWVSGDEEPRARGWRVG